jgi:hypothetical protein
MTERRYRDEEVQQIFKLATTDRIADAPLSPTASGLTLAEIQSIGLEVGIDPDVVTRAAAALDASPPTPARKTGGLPVEVGVSAPLARPLSDREWEMLIADLRHTFRARGQITTHGNLREWRNGNLHASIEPAEVGYRLRLGTRKGDATAMNALGGISILASVATWVSHFVINDPTSLFAPILFGAAGIGAVLANRLRLPAWARQREAQMNQIAARVRSIMEQPGQDDVARS